MATDQFVVSPLLELVSDKLTNLIDKDFGVVWGVEKQMKKLSRSLYTILDVLNDAEEKQVSSLSIQNWLKEVKDVAYAADDVLEDWEYQGPETSNNSFVTKVSDSLRVLIENFDDIVEDICKYDLQRGIVKKRVKICPGRETSSFLTEPQIYGRMKEKEKLVKLLLGQYRFKPTHPRACRPLVKNVNSQANISICPIVGMGGLGKTTLAQIVYNDEQIAAHFEVRSWICVSEDFDVKRHIRAIIKDTAGKECSFEELDDLQRRLQEELRGKRFLLVLDDVWEKNEDEWKKLKAPLSCGKEGSCVIVTTRLKKVASITGTVRRCHLKALSESDCCSLFKQYAFESENEVTLNLMKIGNDIVKKCRGVPLAAKALGGLMRNKSKPHEWSFVRDSEIWELPQNGILPSLRLSYNDLSPHLKQCFGYCSIFPKDHEISRKELINLWMANGFVQSKGRMGELEDVGNEIFTELLWISFFQDIRKDEDGNIVTCKMHDLVHNLACHVAGNECYNVNVGSTKSISRRTRHVSLFYSGRISPSMFESEFIPQCPPSLRSLTVVCIGISPEEFKFIFSHLVCLRALDLSEASIAVLPDSIRNMKHLRYLKLYHNLIKFLPESICDLRNVETLNLAWCRSLETLPERMSEMRNLKHLDIRECHRLIEMPIGMGNLVDLQTLSFFIVGLESGHGINELGGLNDIGGEFEIKGLEHVINPMDAKEANLIKKENLCTLKLCWKSGSQSKESATEVMEGLQPPPNLRQFVVSGYDGVTFPSWSLPKLVEIGLFRCRRCEHLPPLKRLPYLRILKVHLMDLVKFIDEDAVYGEGAVTGGFKSLEDLELVKMHNLEGWSSSCLGSGDDQQAAKVEAERLLFPCLKKLRLRDCPKLRGVPLPSSIESVRVRNCKEIVLGSLQNLPHLSYLQIQQFDELECFPQGMLLNLTALQKLRISSCSNVKALPLERESLTALTELSVDKCGQLVSLLEGLMNLSSLTSLTIARCDHLKCLPKLNKSCLTELDIRYCPELEFSMEEDFQHLVVLQRLSLLSLPKLGHFPDGIKQAVKLQYLHIDQCSEEVMDLPDWVGTLKSLECLRIEGCKNRKKLPEGLQCLAALRELTIRGCDAELERRCEKDTGEDWSKIAHVPSVEISTMVSPEAWYNR